MKRMTSLAAGTAAEELPPSSRWPTLCWYSATIAMVWSLGYGIKPAIDLWWHLASGQLLAARGPFGLTDPWSFTRPGAPWLHHEWLADLGYHLWVRAFGLTSLVYWKWAMLVVTFLLLLQLLRRLVGAPVSCALALFFAAVVSCSSASVRPQLYTDLGYVVVLSSTLGRRPPRWLPLVFLVWANLHGGVVFGLMALAVVLVAHELAPVEDRESRRFRAALALGCAAVCLLNPNGRAAITYPFRYALSESLFRKGIQEWLPPFSPGFPTSPLVAPAIGVAVAAAIVLGVTGVKREERAFVGAGLVLTSLTLAMTLSSRRFTSYFAISASLLVAPALSQVLGGLRHHLPDALRRRGELALAATALVAGLLRLWPYPHTGAAFAPLTEADTFPVEVCNFIDANALSGNVFADYAWGGYLDLRTNGRMKVFIDSRADTVFDEETYRRYRRAVAVEAGWEDVLNDPAIQFALLRRDSRLAIALNGHPQWRRISEDLVSLFFVRVGPFARTLPDPLRPTPDSGYRELAQGAAAMLAKQPQSAAAYFRRALELDPHLYIACRNLVVAEVGADHLSRATETAERCQGIFPDRDLLSLAQSVTPVSNDTAS
jgi:hypothetical protein